MRCKACNIPINRGRRRKVGVWEELCTECLTISNLPPTTRTKEYMFEEMGNPLYHYITLAKENSEQNEY